MMSPTPRGKHAGIINELYDHLRPALPDHLRPYQAASVSMPDDRDDYATPDLLVCDAGFGESDEWLLDPGDVELVCEVVSKGNSSKDTSEMVGWYADAVITDIPVYRHAYEAIANGGVPYADFTLEYPPLAAGLFWFAGVLPGPYGVTFSILMLLALCATIAAS